LFETFTERRHVVVFAIGLLFWQWRGQDDERHDRRRLVLPARATLGGIPLALTAVL